MLRILIADDHTVVRKGLRQILLEEFPSAEIIETADAATLFMKVLREEWDVVITDISMPDKSGLEVLQQIRRDYPRLPVLILSAHSEDQYAIRALKAGANGYLCKDFGIGRAGDRYPSHPHWEEIHHRLAGRKADLPIRPGERPSSP